MLFIISKSLNKKEWRDTDLIYTTVLRWNFLNLLKKNMRETWKFYHSSISVKEWEKWEFLDENTYLQQNGIVFLKVWRIKRLKLVKSSHK